MAASPLILFDGVCNLCNASLSFIIEHDPDGQFRFAPLQSDVWQALMRQHAAKGPQLASVVLLDEDGLHVRSDAALRIARRLKGAWPLLYSLIVLPRPLRDLVYDYIAANRYRWFGKKETCRLPTEEERLRFLPFELPSPSST